MSPILARTIRAITYTTLAVTANYTIVVIAYLFSFGNLEYQTRLNNGYHITVDSLTSPVYKVCWQNHLPIFRGRRYTVNELDIVSISASHLARPGFYEQYFTMLIPEKDVTEYVRSVSYYANEAINKGIPNWTYPLPPKSYASEVNKVYIDFAYGWPFHSLRGRLSIDMATNNVAAGVVTDIVGHGTFVFYPTFRTLYYKLTGYAFDNYPFPKSVDDSLHFPAIPIWRGFLLNSLVYLCMIGFADLAILRPTWRHAGRPALRSLRSWRRRRRIIKLADRRGLCPNCKHPLVPAATDPATNITTPRRCTECGWSDATPPPPSPQPTIAPSV